MDVSKTLPLAKRITAIRESWKCLIDRPDNDLADE